MGRGNAPPSRPPAKTSKPGGRALPSPSSPNSSGKKVKAIYDFFGQGPNDLSFHKGDIITVVSEDSTSGPDWWVGELKGKRGEFPHNHVEVDSGSKATFGSNNSSYTPPGPSVPMSTFSSNNNYPSKPTPNNYSSKPTPRANDDDDKPSKPSKPAKSSFSGGGMSMGDFGEKNPYHWISSSNNYLRFLFRWNVFPLVPNCHPKQQQNQTLGMDWNK